MHWATILTSIYEYMDILVVPFDYKYIVFGHVKITTKHQELILPWYRVYVNIFSQYCTMVIFCFEYQTLIYIILAAQF